jgi:predicted AAA+ superfamily ATPase
MYVKRDLSGIIKESIGSFSGITLTGPRQSGKTTLVKHLFPEAEYHSLENPDTRERAIEDPKGFLGRDVPLMILDEVQHTPSLLSYIQEIMDTTDRKFVLTGSNQLSLLDSVTQSLAGRTATFTLLPFSLSELSDFPGKYSTEDLLLNGFYPSIYDKKRDPTINYRSYYETYIERDVRRLIHVKDIDNYRKFIRICAGRIGQIWNAHSISNELGISSHTVKSWLSTLQASYIVYLVQPFHKNINKRLIKSPKLYFHDVGFASYLLGLENNMQIERDPLYGALFENLCVNELVKKRINQGLDPNIYFYRDSNLNEVDVVQKTGSGYRIFEIKSSSTFHSSFAKSLIHFENNVEQRLDNKVILYQGENLASFNNVEILNYHSYFTTK